MSNLGRPTGNAPWLPLEELRLRLLKMSETGAIQAADLTRVFLASMDTILEHGPVSVYLLDKRGFLSVYSSIELNSEIARIPEGFTVLQHLLTAAWWDTPVPLAAAGETLAGLSRRLAPGRVGCKIVRAPLEGTTQVFGMVEMVCPRAAGGLDGFGGILQAATSILASSITLLRARKDVLVLGTVSKLLAKFETAADDEGLVQMFNSLLQLLPESLHNFRAAVIRAIRTKGTLELCAKIGDAGVDWSRWRDREFQVGDYLAGKAIGGLELLTVPNIASQKELFYNLDWIEANGLNSCICCPLIAENVAVGVLTLYFGFPSNFSELDKMLVESVSNRIASSWARYRANLEREKAAAQLSEERMAIAREAAFDAYERHYLSEVHRAKTGVAAAIAFLADSLAQTEDERAKTVKSVVNLLERQEQSLRALLSGGKQQAPKALTDLNAVVRQVVAKNSMARSMGYPQVESRLLETLPKINVRPQEFVQIVDDLLANSLRAIRAAGRDGVIRITTQLAETERGERAIMLSIWDNGTGIAPSVRRELFEKGVTTSARHGGTGMGLYIIRSIVYALEGEVYCDSELGAWTEIRIVLPLYRLSG